MRVELRKAIEDERKRLRAMPKRPGVEWLVDGLPALCESSPIVRAAVLEGGKIRIDGEGDLTVMGVRRFDLLGEIVFDEVAALTPGKVLAVQDELTGFLKVDGRFARTGVQIYRDADGNEWREYRSPAVVFSKRAMDSFRLSVLTEGHPSDFVTVDNVEGLQVGHGGDVRRDGRFLATPFLVTRKDAIESARDGSMSQLSSGYLADVQVRSGISPEGERFDAVQSDVVGNHNAKVGRGRAGPECCLQLRGDAVSVNQPRPQRGETMKFRIDGKIVDVDDELAKKLKDLGAEPVTEGDKPAVAEGDKPAAAEGDKPATSEGDKPAEPVAAAAPQDAPTRDEVNALKGRLDVAENALKDSRETEGARIDARVGLVSAAQKICGTDYAHEGKTDSQIRTDVILAVSPKLKERIEAHKADASYLAAAFDAALDEHSKRVDSSGDLLTLAARTVEGGHEDELDEAIGGFFGVEKKTDKSGKAAEGTG